MSLKYRLLLFFILFMLSGLSVFFSVINFFINIRHNIKTGLNSLHDLRS